MNVRHAVALSLVGWYLMVPPPLDPYHNRLDAPISQWHVHSAWKTADECRAAQLGIWEDARHRTFDPKDKAFDASVKEGINAAQCIATDDPRLGK